MYRNSNLRSSLPKPLATWSALALLLLPVAAAAGQRSDNAAASPQAGPPADFILDNGTVQIGVDSQGSLNAEGGTLSGPGDLVRTSAAVAGGQPPTTVVGLRQIASNYEAVSYGTPYEGWGIADLETGIGGGVISLAAGGIPDNLLFATPTLLGSGTLKESVGDQLITLAGLELILPTPTDAESDALLAGISGIFVTHDFHPAAIPDAYEVAVTLENSSPFPVRPRYRRTVDWDIDPTPTIEYVTFAGHGASAVVASVGNGFNSPNPLDALEPASKKGALCPENANFTDCGPGDQGAAFDVELPTIDPGESRTFFLYYGVSPSESAALAALRTLGAQAYSLGQSSTDGTPLTFFLGFKTPWAILDNGTVQIGVGPYGELNVPGGTESAGGSGIELFAAPLAVAAPPPPGVTIVGLRNVGLNFEGLAGGTPAEGWGLADLNNKLDGGVRSSLFAGGGLGAPPPDLAPEGEGSNGAFDVAPVAFNVAGAGTLPESIGNRIVVVTDMAPEIPLFAPTPGGGPAFARVVHDFRPSPHPDLYEIRVRIQNLSKSAMAPRYRRLADWDAEDTAFLELVTLQRGSSSLIGESEGGGFFTPRPLTSLSGKFLCPSDASFFDCGPEDLGMAIDFDFPSLAGGRYEFFRLFYGTSTSQAAALAALESVGAEAYSFAQTSYGGESGSPVTYIFGFRDIIFEDGFESGDTSIWASVVPPPF